MPAYGDWTSPVSLRIELFPRGPTEVVVGQGICLLVGESNRGPADEAVGMSSKVMADRLYHSGDLKEAIETAFNQGCSVVYAYRVLGDGNAKASCDLTDGVAVPNSVGTVYARSEGAWGNGLTMKIENHTYDSTDYEVFLGDGTVGPYDLEVWNLVESSNNYVKVNGSAKTIVYSVGDLAPDKVFVDKIEGTITFYTDDAPEATDQIIVSVRYKTLKITLADGTDTVTLYNVRDQVDMEAKFLTTTIARYEPVDDETHLPQTGSYSFSGGSDGAAITTDDWEDALENAVAHITPQTVAITSNEVSPGTYDLIGVLDGFLVDMASDYKPCLGFVGVEPNESVGDLLDLAGAYDNMLLSIVANPWGSTLPRQNFAVGRAAQEAAAALGEACPRIAIHGAEGEGLLNEFSKPDMVTLDGGRLDVLEKKVGIKSFHGINTSATSQFKRCVDVRTINWCMLMIKTITDEWYFRKNTLRNRAALEASFKSQLEDLVRREIIYDNYTCSVWADTDAAPNKVYIDMGVQPVGHMEIFQTRLEIGPDTE